MYPVICVILVNQAKLINPIQNTSQSQLILLEHYRPPTYVIQWMLVHFNPEI